MTYEETMAMLDRAIANSPEHLAELIRELNGIKDEGDSGKITLTTKEKLNQIAIPDDSGWIEATEARLSSTPKPE